MTQEPIAPPNLITHATTFGRFFLEARTRASLTREGIATLCGMKPAEIGRVEAGEIAPPWPPVLLCDIARAITADIEIFLALAATAVATLPSPGGVEYKLETRGSFSAALAREKRTKRLAEAAEEGFVPGAIMVGVRPRHGGAWLYHETLAGIGQEMLPGDEKDVDRWEIVSAVIKIPCATLADVDNALEGIGFGHVLLYALGKPNPPKAPTGETVGFYDVKRVTLTEDDCANTGEFGGW